MNQKDYQLRKKQMEAKRLIPQLEDELIILRKRKTALKGHGTSTAQISLQIKENQDKLKVLRRALKQKTPASAYAMPSTTKRKSLIYTRDAQKRPVQGGRASSK